MLSRFFGPKRLADYREAWRVLAAAKLYESCSPPTLYEMVVTIISALKSLTKDVARLTRERDAARAELSVIHNQRRLAAAKGRETQRANRAQANGSQP